MLFPSSSSFFSFHSGCAQVCICNSGSFLRAFGQMISITQLHLRRSLDRLKFDLFRVLDVISQDSCKIINAADNKQGVFITQENEENKKFT